MKKNSKPSLHRELTPPRQCKARGCRTWLASANEDDYCAACGGWTTQRLGGADAQEATAELYAELMGSSPGEAVTNDAAAHRQLIAAARASATPLRGPKAGNYERRERLNRTRGQRPVLA